MSSASISMTVLSAFFTLFGLTTPPKPLSKIEVMGLLAAGTRSDYLARLAQERGISFLVDEQFTGMLKATRADENLLATLRIVKARPAAQSAVEEQALLHLTNCAAWSVEGVFPSGGECIAALELVPNEREARPLGEVRLSVRALAGITHGP